MPNDVESLANEVYKVLATFLREEGVQECECIPKRIDLNKLYFRRRTDWNPFGLSKHWAISFTGYGYIVLRKDLKLEIALFPGYPNLRRKHQISLYNPNSFDEIICTIRACIEAFKDYISALGIKQ